jgi:molecular chaperone DnaK
MKITLLQGERDLAKDNWKLGELELPFTPAPKGHARIGVQFSIDADGILQVLARDVVSGTEKIVEVAHAIDVSDEAVEAMIADSLEHAFEDRDARLFTEATFKAEEMLPAVEKALMELGSLLTPETAAFVRARAADVVLALESGELTLLKKALHELDEATQTLATLLVEKAMTS